MRTNTHCVHKTYAHTHAHIQDIDIRKDPVRWIRGRLIYIASVTIVGVAFRIGLSVRCCAQCVRL